MHVCLSVGEQQQSRLGQLIDFAFLEECLVGGSSDQDDADVGVVYYVALGSCKFVQVDGVEGQIVYAFVLGSRLASALLRRCWLFHNAHVLYDLVAKLVCVLE